MQESVMQRMWESAHLSGGNAAYVEELYELYLHDPNAVPEEWRTYFQKLPSGGSASADVSHSGYLSDLSMAHRATLLSLRYPSLAPLTSWRIEKHLLS